MPMQRHPSPALSASAGSPGHPEIEIVSSPGPVRNINVSGAREPAAYARRRAGTACVVCRARKTKCDNQRPVCGFCTATGGACRYPDDAPSDHSKLDRGSLAILQRIGEMEQSILGVLRLDPAGHRLDDGQASSASRPSEYHQSKKPRTNLDGGGGGVHKALVEPEDDQPPTADIIFESAEMTVESISRWPVFELEEPPLLVATLGQVDITRSATGENIFELEPEMVVQLVENFLATNHIKNPIFDVDHLWSQVKEFSDNGLKWNGTTCLVLLICSVSVLSPPLHMEAEPGFSQRPDRLARAEMFFQAAQRRIGAVYHENALLTIQCSFLTAVYLMTTFRILAAWKALSQASTQCVGWLATRGRLAESSRGDPFGTADESREVSQGHNERYVEESLYWSCLKSELEVRTELGLPGSSLNEMHYPHVYPSPPSPRQPSRPGEPFPFPGPDAERSSRGWLELGWFFYLAEIALRRIMNEALSARYWRGSWYYTTAWWSAAEHAHLHFTRRAAAFAHKLETWYDMLPPPMRFPRDPGESVGGDPLKGILRGHYIDILDVVLFPAVHAVVHRDVREISPDVLEKAQQALATAVDRITISSEGFYHRHQGTWLMIRTCSRSALLLLGVGLRAQQEAREGRDGGAIIGGLLPSGWRDSVAKVIALVEYWEAESPELGGSLVRFRELYGRVQDDGLVL